MKTLNDAFGEEIRVGDYIGYVSGGKYPTILKGEVVEIRKQLKVRVTNRVSGLVQDDYFWVNARRSVKTRDSWTTEVEDPAVADRDNVNITINVTGDDAPDIFEELRQLRLRRGFDV